VLINIEFSYPETFDDFVGLMNQSGENRILVAHFVICSDFLSEAQRYDLQAIMDIFYYDITNAGGQGQNLTFSQGWTNASQGIAEFSQS
jgi:hypothetical protein